MRECSHRAPHCFSVLLDEGWHGEPRCLCPQPSCLHVLPPRNANACYLQATLAAGNVAAVIKNKPVWNKESVIPFVDGPLNKEPYQNSAPVFAPSIVNAKDLPGDKFPSFQ